MAGKVADGASSGQHPFYHARPVRPLVSQLLLDSCCGLVISIEILPAACDALIIVDPCRVFENMHARRRPAGGPWPNVTNSWPSAWRVFRLPLARSSMSSTMWSPSGEFDVLSEAAFACYSPHAPHHSSTIPVPTRRIWLGGLLILPQCDHALCLSQESVARHSASGVGGKRGEVLVLSDMFR